MMKCNKCGTEFEATVCPECGDCPQVELTKAKKAKTNVLKVPRKAGNRNLCSSLTAVFIDDFRIGRIEKIEIGMPKDDVRTNLGEPHKIEDETLWKY